MPTQSSAHKLLERARLRGSEKNKDIVNGKEDKRNFSREASSLLKLGELENLAKHVKAQGKNKRELLQSLRKTSQQQAGLGWKGLKRSDTEESVKCEVSATSESLEDYGTNRDAHFVQKIMVAIGDSVRLTSAPPEALRAGPYRLLPFDRVD